MTMIEKHIGKEAYQEVLGKLDDNQEFIEVSTAYIEDFLIQLNSENMIETDTTPAELLELPLRFIQGYTQSRSYGFSKTWSNYYGQRNANMHNNDYLLADCFQKVADEDLETAIADLRLFCEVKRINMLYVI